MDNFNYAYYSNTNKLQRVTGSGTQYTYDANGNMITDEINRNRDIKYDHRNLITQIRNKKIVIEDSLVYVTYYFYDEAGNRIRKNVFPYIGIQPSDSVETPDIGDIGDMAGYWDLIKDEVYSRDLSGKEVALYVNGNLMQNNVWGLGNEGYITSSSALNFYLKDHLGSVRAVIDENNSVISGQDYDAWGYLLQGREYHSDGSVYKFTGKERDTESEYDYFGARYSDARIGRWGQVEPLFENYISWSPYNYSLCNPLKFIDIDGKEVFITGTSSINTVNALNESTINLKFAIDQSTGKLSYEGTPLTNQEIFLTEAINSSDILVNLKTTEGNYIENEPFVVGSYHGSEIIDDKTYTYQFFNLAHANVWEEAGGAVVGSSVVHEILESYIGGKLFPGEKGFNKKNYDKAHEETFKLENPKEYYPKVRHYYKSVKGGKVHEKTTLYNKKRNKEYIVYKNQ